MGSLLALVRRHPRWLFGLGVLFLFVGLRVAFIDADPPWSLPNGYAATELFVEPPAKSHEARNYALFGAFKTNPVDNYQFWRAQSPAWVYPLAGVYSVFGVRYATLRTFATATSALGLVGLLLLVRRRLSGVGQAALGAFVACDYIGLHYGRVGLLEPALDSVLVFVVLGLLLARRHVLWLVPVQWAFALALLTKQTGLYMGPLVLAFGVPLWLRAPRAGSKKRWMQGVVLGHALVLGGALVAYALTDEYLRTVFWNIGHVVHGEDGATSLDAENLAATTFASNFINVTKLWRFISTYPIAGVLATFEAGRLAHRLWKKRSVAPWQKLALAWLGSAALTLLATKLTDVRFYVLLAPPVALLAASAVESLVRSPFVRAKRHGKKLAIAATVGAFLAHNGFVYVMWTIERTYQTRDAARDLEARVGDEKAVIVGLWAAPVVLGTPYLHYYVKNDFNATRASLDALGITHLLLRDTYDYARTILEREYPGELAAMTPTTTYVIRDRNLSLFTLAAPLGAPPPKPLLFRKLPILRAPIVP